MPGEITPSNSPPPSPDKSSIPWAPEVFQQFVVNQAKEIEVRQQEIALAAKSEDNNFDFAKRSLDAQSTLFERDGVRRHSRMKWVLVCSVIVGLIVASFLLALALTGHEQMALELVKAVIYGTLGSTAGYGIGRNRRLPGAKQETDSDSDN